MRATFRLNLFVPMFKIRAPGRDAGGSFEWNVHYMCLKKRRSGKLLIAFESFLHPNYG
jgi:hypothetical protein